MKTILIVPKGKSAAVSIANDVEKINGVGTEYKLGILEIRSSSEISLEKVDNYLQLNSDLFKYPIETVRELKPPLGVVPRYIRESERLIEISEAIGRYLDAMLVVPPEWLSERNEIISAIKGRDNKAKETKEKISFTIPTINEMMVFLDIVRTGDTESQNKFGTVKGDVQRLIRKGLIKMYETSATEYKVTEDKVMIQKYLKAFTSNDNFKL